VRWTVLISGVLALVLGVAAGEHTGIITTEIGTGESGFAPDETPGREAALGTVYDVEVDGVGAVFIADTGNHVVRRLDPTSMTVRTVAGNGVSGFSGDGADPADASLDTPMGVAIDDRGTVFIADTGNNRIRRIDPTTGSIETVAGNGTFGFSGDGGPATVAAMYAPRSVALDHEGRLLIADTNNHRIRRVDVDGTISTIAGNGAFGFAGDGKPAIEAMLAYPWGIAVAPDGDIVLGDYLNDRVRRIDAETGIISTVAGRGPDAAMALTGDAVGTLGSLAGRDTIVVPIGDGGPATSAFLYHPRGVAVDAHGTIFVADTGNSRIRHIDANTGVIDTVAGTGAYSYWGDGGPGDQAALDLPMAVAVAPSADLWIADTSNLRVRRVS